jgi:hypothetical protein
MTKKFLFLTIVAVCIIASCKTSKTGSRSASGDTIVDSKVRKITRDKELYAAVKEIVPLDTAYLVNDTLHIVTKKILGCGVDNFKLMWNGAIKKSLPAQTNVKLFQQVDAGCKQQHRFHLAYNVSSIHFKSDSMTFCLDSCTARSIKLHLGGYKNAMQYEFEQH